MTGASQGGSPARCIQNGPGMLLHPGVFVLDQPPKLGAKKK